MVMFARAVNRYSCGFSVGAAYTLLQTDSHLLEHCCLITECSQFSKNFPQLKIPTSGKKGNAKQCSRHRTIAFILHTSKVMLEILQARLQQYMNRELPDVQTGFRKGRGIRDQIANIRWIIEKARGFQKNIYFCYIDYTKAFGHEFNQTPGDSEGQGSLSYSSPWGCKESNTAEKLNNK